MLCALCKAKPAIEDSHIVPAFVFRWLKESSPTGFLRGTENPNKREQDGVKHPLLCESCEDRFSKWESLFSSKVFREIHQHNNTSIAFDYEEWLIYFCVSISWRSLTHLAKAGDLSDLPFGHGSNATAALEHWRRFLLEEVNNLDVYRQHLLITDVPTSTQGIKNDSDLALYLERAVDLNTIHDQGECYVITKMCNVTICGTVLDSMPNQWAGTVVSTDKGRYGPGDFRISGCVFKFFESGIDAMKTSRKSLSTTQSRRILESFFKRFPDAKKEWERFEQKQKND